MPFTGIPPPSLLNFKLSVLMGNFWQSAGGGALISGVGSFGSGLFGGLFARRAQKRQYQYNLSLQKQQQEWQRTMWDLENQYNLPKNEVSRLLEAGINPALAFSNGGATAAPVPHSGSAGGVSAPTSEMPNVGASAVLAAQSAQRLENETKVADSTSAKLDAEAEEAKERTRESSSRADLNELSFSIRSQLESTIVNLGKLNYSIRLFDRDLISNRLIRDDWDTSYHLTGIQLRQEDLRQGIIVKRSQIKVLNRDVDRIGALVDLYRSQSRLTDEQANLVACRVYASMAQAVIGKMRYNAAVRLSNSYATVDGVRMSIGDAFFKQLSAQFTADLDKARSDSLNSALNLAYIRSYGKESLDLDYNLKKQRFYLGRMNLWLGAERFILDGANQFLRSNPSYDTPQVRSFFDHTFSEFDYRGSISPDESWNNF